MNNSIPMTRFDPVSLKVLSYVPLANNLNFAGNYQTTEPGNRYSAIPAFKLDHNIDAKDKLSFYYSENTTANQFNPTLGQTDGLPNTITAARGSFHYQLPGAAELRPYPDADPSAAHRRRLVSPEFRRQLADT